MNVNLTIEEVKKTPQNFLYIFASDKFLSYIDAKYASTIRTKRANQNLVLMRSADKHNKTYEEYFNAIQDSFIKIFDIKPEDALIKLAMGEEVAGKNWAKGVFGIGKIGRYDFAGSNVTTDAQTGYMVVNGEMVSSTEQVFDTKKGSETGLYQQIYKDLDTGKVYVSQYNKTLKKWYAQSYSDADGKTFNADGSAIGSADMSTIWEGIGLSLTTFLNWLLSLFGISTGNKDEQLTEAKVLPNQVNDGFVFESGSGLLLVAAAAGALIFGSMAGDNKKKKKK